ncbi:MAG: HAMP domain-containing protein [Acidobacteriota bacterium]|nr:HAMP domain-containing protein [Acidobacteriota bacterium]
MRHTLSIRTRLAAWYTGVLIAIVCSLGAMLYAAVRRTAIADADAVLRSRLADMAPFINGRLHGRHAAELAHEFETHLSGLAPGGTLLQVSDPQGRWIYQSASIRSYEISATAPGEAGAVTLATVRHGGAVLRVISSSIRADGHVYAVQLAISLTGQFQMLDRLRDTALWLLPIAAALSWLGGYWLCGRALAPVDEMVTTAGSISASRLDLRVNAPRTGDELQRLGDTLNAMIERLDRGVRRITDFTANAAHELRTPVGILRTTAELALHERATDEDRKAALANVEAEAVNLTAILDSLMALARSDAGEHEGLSADVDLNTLAETAVRRISPLARTRQIDLTWNVPEVPVMVRGSRGALLGLVTILLDNAVKYTPAGGQVKVSLETRIDDVLLQVDDTGIGIAPDDLPHIFERFYRADRTGAAEGGGSGLGLALARSIADAHNARLDVHSTPGAGSTFQLRMAARRNQSDSVRS